MSQCTLPILYFNLGGEMLYIIQQRLQAQGVQPEKAHRVMCDLVHQMMDESCLLEVLKYQPVYDRNDLKTVFERLAHSSIMKMNSASMDKLYDLMLMAVKYQVVMCRKPEELLLVTFNHLDGMRKSVGGSLEHVDLINSVYRRTKEFFELLTPGHFWNLKQRLLLFFQDLNKRVSVLLRDQAQQPSGHFILPPTSPVSPQSEVPGSIRYYRKDNLHVTHKFVPPMCFLPAQPLGSFELEGNRRTLLGTNMFSPLPLNQNGGTHPGEEEEETLSRQLSEILSDSDEVSSSGSVELSLLASLVGLTGQSAAAPPRINLFSSDDNRDGSPQKNVQPAEMVIQVDGGKARNKQLAKTMEEFDQVGEAKEQDGEDLLDLLDAACSTK